MRPQVVNWCQLVLIQNNNKNNIAVAFFFSVAGVNASGPDAYLKPCPAPGSPPATLWPYYKGILLMIGKPANSFEPTFLRYTGSFLGDQQRTNAFASKASSRGLLVESSRI